MNNIITRDHFVACIETLREADEMARKINSLVNEYNRSDFISGYAFNDSEIELKLIETLEFALGDIEHWISWFCFENDYGAGNGFWLDADGNEHTMKTADELYDFLTKEN